MADFKDESVYNRKTLTRVFFFSSLVLLACVIWMMWQDDHRPWKNYQRQFMALERSRAVSQKSQAVSSMDLAQYKLLEQELQKANQDLKSHEAAIDQLHHQEAQVDNQIFKVNTVEIQPLKAQLSLDQYTYSQEAKAGTSVAALGQKITNETHQASLETQQLFVLHQHKDQIDQNLENLYSKRDSLQESINEMLSPYLKLKNKIDSLSFNFLFYFRNAMWLDFMSPTIQIRQVVLKNLPEDLYFAKTMRVDRCMTCHMAIDQKGYENAPEPFRTHPHLDLYVGASSPHPMDKVGCTICHGGMGPSLDFNDCAHVPNDAKEAQRWRKEYGWQPPQNVQSIMIPLKYAESSCLKCHGTQEYVNSAPELDRGRQLMVTRGCLGCHDVKNLEGLPKAGPSLLRIQGKLQKEFVEKWVWDPQSFNPNARMPSFFQQTNNSDPESLAKTKAELHSIVEYLYSLSGDYTPAPFHRWGDVARGKKIFETVGCLACHGINDVTSYHSDFAPDLSSTGSKLSAAFVDDWIRNPQHYDPQTRMPSLRLTRQEAADVTAYLMSKRNRAFDQMPVPQSNPAIRDELILEVLKPQYGVQGAQVQLAKLSDRARELFLGEKSLNKYGCFACHMIQGFQTAQAIGPELSDWGSKQVDQLDFGTTSIEHTREAFLNAKLKDPRQFDQGKKILFQDQLIMPNFHLSDADREAIVTAVLGLTGTYVPDEMRAGIHGNGALLEKGRRVIAKFNCAGCHLIEGQGGDIRQWYQSQNIDLAMAPPDLNKEGSKVQVQWLHHFLMKVHPIRPWLRIRMPSFHWSDEDLSDLITYFNLKDDQVYPFETMTTTKLTGSDLLQAQALFAALQCQKCHILGSVMPADLSSAAPDLFQVHSRLKPQWVLDWLQDPEALMPGTRMPTFWPQPQDSSPVSQYFEGDSKKQREALRDYLFMLGQTHP